jgi:hypothetical protein
LSDRSFNKPEIIRNLNVVFNKIDALKPLEYHTIGFIGGELFEKRIVEDADIFPIFKKLMQKIIELHRKDHIRSIWITANLVEKNPPYLYELCNGLNTLEFDASKNKSIWICTSYDTRGRFHTQDKLDNWHKNMKLLTKKYPKDYLVNNLNNILLSLGFRTNRVISDLNRTVVEKTPFILAYIFTELGLIYVLKFISQNFSYISHEKCVYYKDAGSIFIQAENLMVFTREMCLL